MLQKFFLFFTIYFLTDQNLYSQHAHSLSNSKTDFQNSSKQIMRLPKAKPTETIILENNQSYDLKAIEVREKFKGKWFKRLAYNGMIPGPTLIAKKNSKIKLTLTNLTSFPTTLHSHGLRVDDKNDGVPGIGQDPIAPGKSFTYELNFPDVGLHWYHPHISEDITQDLGLQGTYLVVDESIDLKSNQKLSKVLVLDDLLLDDKGLSPFTPQVVTHALMGRYGNQLLVNNTANSTQRIGKGEVWRYYFVNTANARPFKLAFKGAKMKVVASDQSNFENEYLAESLTISPGERYIVDVLFDFETPNKIATLYAVIPGGDKTIITYKQSKLAISPAKSSLSFSSLNKDAFVKSDIAKYLKNTTQKPDKILLIDAKITGPLSDHVMDETSNDGIEWEDTMPGMSGDYTSKEVQWFFQDQETKKTNMDINWVFKYKVPTKIRIENLGKTHPMQHPIHFHGQRFLVIARNNKPQTNLVWKDTSLLPAGETMDIVLDNENRGKWMAHCHISEHLAVGMMIGFEVQ